MKLKSLFLLLLYFGFSCLQGVYAENGHGVKRGMYPYMAFIHYSDPTVVDLNGQRFIRSAVLVRPDWLVTTAIGPSLMDPPNGFPTKTLLARAGAVIIDSKLTLNEDEDEQEREIVQIVRPLNHSATQWWTTDISLMKTLLPFNMTSTVGFKIPNVNPEAIDPKTCSILVYAKINGNATEDKSLIMLFVELLPPTIENCGSHFTDSTMICATDSDENKDVIYDPDFCQGNSGGPLICENEVVALQTYVGNDCKEPHLYQLLSAWDKFINCTVENKCQEQHCGNVCDVSYKDPPKTAEVTTPTVTIDTLNDKTSSGKVNIFDDPTTTPEITTSTTTTTITTSTSSTTSSEVSSHETMKSPYPTLTMSTITERSPKTTAVVTEAIEIPTVFQQMSFPNVKDTMLPGPQIKENTAVKESTTPNETTLSWLGSWPKEITPPNVYDENKTEIWKRKPKVEAQQSEDTQHRAKKVHKYSVSNSHMCVIQTVLFGFTVLLCL